MRKINQIIYIISTVILVFVLTGIFTGCTPRKPIQRDIPPPVEVESTPRLLIRIGSIDLSQYQKKIERSDVKKFAAQIKKDSLDILTVQGITRYPDLPNRIDVVDELKTGTGMSAAFGETMTLSGRQSGNGIFSYYPIKSYESTPYSNLRSTRFESALQAIIDCGEREIVVISTQLPEKTEPEEQSVITSTLGGFTIFYINRPIIISGNLILAHTMRSLTAYDSIENPEQKSLPKYWYSNDGSIMVSASETVETALGRIFRVEFNVSHNFQP